MSARGAALAGRVLALLLRIVGATWRVRAEGAPPAVGGLGATWHAELVPLVHHFRDRGVAVGVSRSRDGDLAAAALGALGFPDPPRGSSSRGGAAAFRALLRRLRSGATVGIVTDGPRGPAGVSKPGVVALARRGGAAIVPIGVAARPALRLGSWDRLLVPLPFAAVALCFGAPIAVPRDADSESCERARLALDRALRDENARAQVSLPSGWML